MKITKELLDDLSNKACESPRLRTNLDLRNNEEDTSQRMLNALQMGTIVPIHRHRQSSETLIVIRGAIKETYFDEDGNVTETIVVSANGPIYGINIPKGQWHTLEALEPDTIIIETKNGKYEPTCPEDIMDIEVLIKK